MLQHYLVSMNTEKSAGMIDISRLVRENFSSKLLERYIFEDNGGNSLKMLKYIFEKDSIVSSTKIDTIEQDLKEFGPLLVSMFHVHDDFYNSPNCIFHGKLVGNLKGYHSMILIGVRSMEIEVEVKKKVRKRMKVKKVKKFFLLQNWWKKKQFIEVDEEYLELSSPTLYFVKTPQLSIPENFSQDYEKYSENENLDKPESFPEIEGPIKGMLN